MDFIRSSYIQIRQDSVTLPCHKEIIIILMQSESPCSWKHNASIEMDFRFREEDAQSVKYRLEATLNSLTTVPLSVLWTNGSK